MSWRAYGHRGRSGRYKCPAAAFLITVLAAGLIRKSVHAGADVITPRAASQVLSLFKVSEEWPSRSLGNHRVRLQLDDDAEMAWARVEWRLPGLQMEDRQPVLINEHTGRRVSVVVVSATSDAAEILFEANDSARRRGGARGDRRRRPGELRRQADDSYTYDESTPVAWKPRTEAGCQCTGYKNAHGFGAHCKAWEEGLDPNQTPWCYVSTTCRADDVRRGSFGEAFVNCAPVYAEDSAGSARGLASDDADDDEIAEQWPADGRQLGARRRLGRPSTFLLYYLPFDDGPCATGPASSCTSYYAGTSGSGGHGRLPSSAQHRQRARAVLGQADWRAAVSSATVVGFEARTARDSFHPMEVAATAVEMRAVRAHCASRGRRLLVWAEDRTHPIRMLDRLPIRWLAAGVPAPRTVVHAGTALRGEFYTWQLGVHAPLASVRVLPRWAALHGPGGESIPAWRLRCINVPNGSAQAADGVQLLTGAVQPLWLGVDVPLDVRPGTYRGRVRVVEVLPGGGGGSGGGGGGGGTAAEEEVALELHVEDGAIEQHGDSELWRHSRLRWLDSTAGEGTVAVDTRGGGVGARRSRADVWQPVSLDEATMTMSASGRRAIGLSRRGLPLSLKVGDLELLAEPVQLRLLAAGASAGGAAPSSHEIRWSAAAGAPSFVQTASGGIQWRAVGAVSSTATTMPAGCRGMAVELSGELHTDGLAQVRMPPPRFPCPQTPRPSTPAAFSPAVRRAPPPSPCSMTAAPGRRLAAPAVPIPASAPLTAAPPCPHLPPFSPPPPQVAISLRAAAGGSCALADVQLRLPLVERATRLINGFGIKGAARPERVVFKWDVVTEDPGGGHGQAGLNCRVWLGSAAAGVQLNLQGLEQSKSAAASHCGNDEDGRLVCDDLTDAQYNVALGSTAWANRHAGGATVQLEPASTRPTLGGARRRRLARRGAVPDPAGSGGGQVAVLSVFTGALVVGAAEPILLPFRLLLTPVRGAGLPHAADFGTRYFHMQRYTTVAQATAAAPQPWIILHQGNQLNPYINYPFLTVERLRAYVREAHAVGAKVKLYYTVRELSTSAVELWALRSLGGEVIVPSRRSAGHAWLKEHVRANYSAAWHERLADGEVDASVHTPAFTTRWDNYWIEGILWLVRNVDIDGIYLDGAPCARTRAICPGAHAVRAHVHAPVRVGVRVSA